MAIKLSKYEASKLGIGVGNKHDRHTVDRLRQNWRHGKTSTVMQKGKSVDM
ncbi:MAG: hypothetical protein U9Q62_04565 [Campylobacterota bacterium]|nr:hypothetical protein [Campylobacterota bacterium]